MPMTRQAAETAWAWTGFLMTRTPSGQTLLSPETTCSGKRGGGELLTVRRGSYLRTHLHATALSWINALSGPARTGDHPSRHQPHRHRELLATVSARPRAPTRSATRQSAVVCTMHATPMCADTRPGQLPPLNAERCPVMQIAPSGSSALWQRHAVEYLLRATARKDLPVVFD